MLIQLCSCCGQPIYEEELKQMGAPMLQNNCSDSKLLCSRCTSPENLLNG